MMNFIKIAALCSALLLCLFADTTKANSADSIRAGSSIEVYLRGLPAEEASQINGQYRVSQDGTISMPHLRTPVRAAGLTANQLALNLAAAYKANEIYNNPTFVILANSIDKEGDRKTLTVGGYVRSPQQVIYKPDMTFFDAVNAAGGLTDYGSRYVKFTRGGKTQTLDYFSQKARSKRVEPNDQIEVTQRGFTEGRPSGVVP